MGGGWAFYFAIKLYLYAKGILNLDALLNLLLCLFIALPLPKKLALRPEIAASRKILIIGGGASLLWHDSWLPSPAYIYAFLRDNGVPSFSYLVSLIVEYFNPHLLFAAVFGLVLCMILANYLKLLHIAALALAILLPIQVFGKLVKSDAELLPTFIDDFFTAEELRRVTFPPKSETPLPFDIVFVHVCSLGWDDLAYLHIDKLKFLQSFDLLFTKFNAATSYSGPAMIRLMSAPCGQRPHSKIYDARSDECGLMQQLQRQGYRIFNVLNHDGKYGSYKKQLEGHGLIDIPLRDLAIFPIVLRMFDGSPIYSDIAVLDQWLLDREKLNKPAALYYNSVSLHDGVYSDLVKEWWNIDRVSFYEKTLHQLIADMEAFIKHIEGKGRPTILFFLGEHGMALRGSRYQKSKLRDIPLPSITTVPFGVRFIGKQYPKGVQRRIAVIERPVSYVAIAHLLAAFLKNNPFGNEHHMSQLFLDSIPTTEFLSENEESMTMRYGTASYLRQKNSAWTKLDE